MVMKNDFSKGRVWKNIVSQALPLLLAQFVQLLYNVVDRIYIGHLPDIGSIALTGIGLAFPITSLVAAFTNLFATGGAPLFSMARGAGEEEKAERIMGQVVSLLVISSFVIFAVCFIWRRPILYLFGASDASYVYADTYLRIYLFGTTFSMFATGMNGFINAQGFPRTGMLTICLGAIMNLILDPIFIFVFDMGVAGAALATVISQLASAVWVLIFFIPEQRVKKGTENHHLRVKNRTLYQIRRKNLKIEGGLFKDITALGLAGFCMQATNCLVQIVCNMTLRTYGGDLYVGIMTVLNSVRDILFLPVQSIGNGAQPVLGYNYGARKYRRVRQGIRFAASMGIIYTILAWLVAVLCPHLLMSLFTSSQEMIGTGTAALKIYFFGFCFMAFQFAGQSTFTALGCAKRAIFFSLLRKVIIVVPLTVLLPMIGYGVNGVFLAEPISNAIGGSACFITMWLTLYRKLPKEDLK